MGWITQHPFGHQSSLLTPTREARKEVAFTKSLVAKSSQRNTGGSSRTENPLSHERAKS